MVFENPKCPAFFEPITICLKFDEWEHIPFFNTTYALHLFLGLADPCYLSAEVLEKMAGPKPFPRESVEELQSFVCKHFSG